DPNEGDGDGNGDGNETPDPTPTPSPSPDLTLDPQDIADIGDIIVDDQGNLYEDGQSLDLNDDGIQDKVTNDGKIDLDGDGIGVSIEVGGQEIGVIVDGNGRPAGIDTNGDGAADVAIGEHNPNPTPVPNPAPGNGSQVPTET